MLPAPDAFSGVAAAWIEAASASLDLPPPRPRSSRPRSPRPPPGLLPPHSGTGRKGDAPRPTSRLRRPPTTEIARGAPLPSLPAPLRIPARGRRSPCPLVVAPLSRLPPAVAAAGRGRRLRRPHGRPPPPVPPPRPSLGLLRSRFRRGDDPPPSRSSAIAAGARPGRRPSAVLRGSELRRRHLGLPPAGVKCARRSCARRHLNCTRRLPKLRTPYRTLHTCSIRVQYGVHNSRILTTPETTAQPSLPLHGESACPPPSSVGRGRLPQRQF